MSSLLDTMTGMMPPGNSGRRASCTAITSRYRCSCDAGTSESSPGTPASGWSGPAAPVALVSAPSVGASSLPDRLGAGRVRESDHGGERCTRHKPSRLRCPKLPRAHPPSKST